VKKANAVVVRELMDKANVKIQELEEGPVYLMLVNESECDSEALTGVREMLEPADVRIIEVLDVNKIKLFELVAK
jgi:hypothetical protein